jgi:hypothetical protein
VLESLAQDKPLTILANWRKVIGGR